jgi:hypothetical protein
MADVDAADLAELYDLADKVVHLLQHVPGLVDEGENFRQELDAFIQDLRVDWGTYPGPLQNLLVPELVDALRDRWRTLLDNLRSADGRVDFTNEQDTIFEAHARLLRAAASAAPDASVEDRVAVMSRLQGLERQWQLRRLEREVERARSLSASVQTDADVAKAGAKAVKVAAGEVGQAVLEQHFTSYAGTETKAARIYRGAAVLLLAAAVTALVLWDVGRVVSVQDILSRAAFGLVTVGFAGYLLREAGRRQRTAEWAETAAVQLKTIEAFLTPMDSRESLDEVRLLLARKVFGDPPGVTDGNEPVLSTADVLDRVLKILRQARPGAGAP